MTGSIQVRTLKGGTKRYHAVWRAGGKQKRKAFSRKKDATRFLADTVKKVHDGTYVETRPAMMREVFAAWLSDLDTRVILGEIKPSTSSTYRGNVNKHFVPALGDYRSDQLTARIINKWRRELAERIGAGDMARKSYNKPPQPPALDPLLGPGTGSRIYEPRPAPGPKAAEDHTPRGRVLGRRRHEGFAQGGPGGR